MRLCSKEQRRSDVSVLKWHTPLEGLASHSLSVTRNGYKIPYDGICMKRGNPGHDEFVLAYGAGQTVRQKFDVSEGYDVTRVGTYSIAVDTYLEYAEGNAVSGDPTKVVHRSSFANRSFRGWRK